MKKIFSILALLILITAITTAQTSNANDFLGKISLSVMLDQQTEALYPTQKTKIESKIISLVSRYGISGQGPANFVINPRLEIYDEKVVEGMRNLTVVTLELNLFIKQAKANIIYATYNKQLQGTGYNKNEAITNAISQINANDPAVKTFIEEGKQKIISFYNSKCNDIVMEADKYAGMNDFERALAILNCVPVEATPCYQKIKDKSIAIFKKYQSKNCESVLLSAKANIAGNNFIAALNTLALVDPTSSCFSQTKSLITSTESKLDAQDKLEWSRQRELMKDKLELEKLQIQATRDITVAQLNKKPTLLDSILGFLF